MLCLGVVCFVYLNLYRAGCYGQCLSGDKGGCGEVTDFYICV